MSIPDEVMGKYARLVTRWTPPQIATIENAMKEGKLHPRDAKMQLAFEITSSFYGNEAATRAQDEFVRLFQKHAAPSDIPEFHLAGDQTVLEVLVAAGLVTSRGEGRRLVEQRGVRLDGQVLENPGEVFPHPGVLQAGKRHFVRVI